MAKGSEVKTILKLVDTDIEKVVTKVEDELLGADSEKKEQPAVDEGEIGNGLTNGGLLDVLERYGVTDVPVIDGSAHISAGNAEDAKFSVAALMVNQERLGEIDAVVPEIKELTLTEKIIAVRVRLDGLAQLTEGLKPLVSHQHIGQALDRAGEIVNARQLAVVGVNSKEIDKAVDSLKLGKAWLGELLGKMGSANPYGSGYKTKEDIMPTSDVLEVFMFDGWSDYGHIEKVDWLRREIQEVADTVGALRGDLMFETSNEGFAAKSAYDRVKEAKFWLFFELGRIRDAA